MGKLTLVTSKQMCKIAERCGFYKDRQKGSHIIYTNSKKKRAVMIKQKERLK